MSVNVGDVLDEKYRILRLIGEGGMGAVYEGENTLIARRVAIKVLYGAAAISAEAIQRFEREAQAAGRIGNDHILEILDLGRLPDGSRYLVMEYLDGETLGARIQRLGRMTPKDLVPIFNQLLVGLAAAHEAGIVHRDLKPDNIFILKEKAGRKDFAKIIDFGISKFQETAGDHSMTRTGTVMGTPFYMSPEQAKGARADARSDLYAVGAMLYEASSGTVPFDGKTFNELMFKIVLSEPQSLTELAPDLAPGFANLVLKGMAKEAEHRFQTAKEFGDALERWNKTGESVNLPPRSTPKKAEPIEQGAPHPMQAVAARAGATNGSWAQSKPKDQEKRSIVGWTLLGGIAVLVVGGVIAAVTWLGHGTPANSTEEAPRAASGVVSTLAAQPAPPAPELKHEPVVAPVSEPAVSQKPAPEVAAPPPVKVATQTKANVAPLPKPAPVVSHRTAQKEPTVEEKPSPEPPRSPATVAPAKTPKTKPKVDFGY